MPTHQSDHDSDSLSAAVWKLAERAIVAGDARTLEHLLRDHTQLFREERPQSEWAGGLAPDYERGDSRSIIVSTHHFENWPQFEAYAAALADRNSPIATFEAAADAIVSGNAEALSQMLARQPELVRERSTRTHHAMLLHYVGANGIEGFRQRTPPNIVSITEMLLNAGAEVDAVADMYGGATALGLVATSIHPKAAGLQEPVIDVLLSHGARIDHPRAAGNGHSLVNGCLANGRGEAAAFLARRGALLDLEGAAGVGRLDAVAQFFNRDGSLTSAATETQMLNGLAWASEYGRTNVVEFLLARGVHVDTRLPHHGTLRGHTALHWAAFGAHVDTVKLLLERNAPVDVKDDTYGTTPLGWTLYAFSNEPSMACRERYHAVVALLVAAGSKVERDWLADEKIRADPNMLAALGAA